MCKVVKERRQKPEKMWVVSVEQRAEEHVAEYLTGTLQHALHVGIVFRNEELQSMFQSIDHAPRVPSLTSNVDRFAPLASLAPRFGKGKND